MAKKRQKTRPTPVLEVLQGVLGRLQDEQVRRTGTRSLEIFAAFDGIGPPVTDHAEPTYFRGGVLTLRVDGSTWLTELSFLEGRILERLNEALGRKAVKGLRLRLGQVRRRPPKVPPPRALTPKEEAEIEAWTAGIGDEAVRRAVARAASVSLARGPTEGPPPSGPPGPRIAPTPPPEPEPGLTYGFGDREVDRWQLRRRKAEPED